MSFNFFAKSFAFWNGAYEMVQEPLVPAIIRVSATTTDFAILIITTFSYVTPIKVN